ncbi:hypothetical protein C0033_11055 [Clostridium sp. chh4-2]|nr:hypothetical protein C0033_11055 [Clostridium sp. chh4-2]
MNVSTCFLVLVVINFLIIEGIYCKRQGIFENDFRFYVKLQGIFKNPFRFKVKRQSIFRNDLTLYIKR